jgi:glycosyltransferase involved in cell wall biosynthesis
LISIIVPVYNEEKNIDQTMRSLMGLKTKKKHEIIVVDSQSEDKTIEIVEKYKKTSKKIKLIKIKDRNISKARNIGIKSAEGEYLFFIDSGFSVPEDWIEIVIANFEDKNVMVVGGGIRDGSRDFFSRFKSYDKIYREGFERRPVDVLPFTNVAVKREVFDEVGPLDEFFRSRCEDSDLFYRISSAGYKIIFNPEIKVTKFEREKPIAFFKRMFTDGYWHFYLYLKHKEKIRGDDYRSSIFVLQSLFWFFALLAIINPIFLLVPLVLILISNRRFLKFSYNKTGSLLTSFGFYLILLVRTLLQLFGFICGMVYYSFKRYNS